MRGRTRSQICSQFRHLLTSEDGPTAVEYTVMLALVLVACISIVSTLGQSASSTFSTINSSLAGS
jgi:pilus assembly protein Flp/PilA